MLRHLRDKGNGMTRETERERQEGPLDLLSQHTIGIRDANKELILLQWRPVFGLRILSVAVTGVSENNKRERGEEEAQALTHINKIKGFIIFLLAK
jgi:hypothetical protein